MRVSWESYLERLGPQGLRLVVSSLLSAPALARLSGDEGVELSAPERAQLIVELATDDLQLATKLLDEIDRVSDDAQDRPENWEKARLRETLAEMLRAPSASAANILHRLARGPRPPLPAAEIRAAAELIAPELLGEAPGSRPKWVAKVASSPASLRELERDRRELETRVRQLESQLSRAIERSASVEERLGRRLDETRTLRQELRAQRDERSRLERENARLKKRIDDLLERRAKERTGEITAALRRLTTEQRRTSSLLERLREREGEGRGTLREHGREIGGLSKLMEQLVSIEEAQARASAAAQEEILRELGELRETISSNGSARNTEKSASSKDNVSQPRVAVFVDVQNMFYGAREKGARLDFEALLSSACSGRQLVRAVAYVVEAREIDQSAFIHLLQMKAYEVKRKPLRIRPDRSAKGNWDLEMALDALTTAEHVDVVVLVTGDGDFVPLVRELKLKGIRVEVYGFRASSAPDLREAADKFVNVTRRLLRPLKTRQRP